MMDDNEVDFETFIDIVKGAKYYFNKPYYILWMKMKALYC